MNLYIDEHYHSSSNRTIIAIVKVRESGSNKIYEKLKKIIIKKESSKKVRRHLLTELKSKKLIGKKYWPMLLSKILNNIEHAYAVIPCQPNNKKQFQLAYTKVIKELLMNRDIKIFADNINNKKFMEPIVVGINDNRFKFCDSEKVKGIQLADLVASTYKDKYFERTNKITIHNVVGSVFGKRQNNNDIGTNN